MVSRLAPFQHAFVQRLSELGITYHGSPIVEGPGQRYFDSSMGGGRVIGRGIGSRFLLLMDDKGSPAGEAAKQIAGEFSDVVELRPSGHSGVKLIRPDGYIAYSGHNGNSTAALDRVRALLERQVTRESGGAGS